MQWPSLPLLHLHQEMTGDSLHSYTPIRGCSGSPSHFCTSIRRCSDGELQVSSRLGRAIPAAGSSRILEGGVAKKPAAGVLLGWEPRGRWFIPVAEGLLGREPRGCSKGGLTLQPCQQQHSNDMQQETTRVTQSPTQPPHTSTKHPRRLVAHSSVVPFRAAT